MAKEVLHRIRRPGDWNYNGIPADEGRIFPLEQQPNDEKLIRLGYLEPLPGKKELTTFLQCGECGGYFESEQARQAHGDRQHRRRAYTPAIPDNMQFAGQLPSYSATGVPPGLIIPDTEGDNEDQENDRRAPLYLDKTLASQQGA